MAWAPSPSGSVWRKRVHLVGPPESGQVTSVVRYEPRSRFPAHDHPEGEEILVLEGVFSDEHGDWPAGTYLLNPEGFRHAPFSEPGCVLFVKLRQFPGRERQHVVLDTSKLRLGGRAPIPGVNLKDPLPAGGLLGRDAPRALGARRRPGSASYEQGAEFFVLDGEFADEAGAYSEGCWLRLPAGCSAPSPLRARLHALRQACWPALSEIGRLECGDGLHFDQVLLADEAVDDEQRVRRIARRPETSAGIRAGATA